MSHTQAPSPFRDTEWAANYLGEHSKTLGRWRAKGRGPRYVRLEGRIRYTQQDLDAFVAASTVDPATAATARNRTRRKQLRAAPERVTSRAARKPAA